MFFRSQVSVCLFVACFVSYSSLARSEDPPAQAIGQPEWEAQIEAALDEKGEWDFFDAPLVEVCRALQDSLGIDVVLDTKALEDFGIDPSTPITRKIGGISNRSHLRLMLNALELTFTTRHGALWITTPEEAEARLISRVYPVGDLLALDRSSGELAPDYDSLIQVITTNIAPDTWDAVGGPGAINGIYKSIVVSQTADIHELVERFVEVYRTVIAKDREPDRVQQTVFMLREALHSAAHAALDKPLTAEFKDTPLNEATEFIADAMNIPIVIDTKALEDFGIDSRLPVTGQFENTPLRIVLARLLNDLELTFFVRDEVLLISTPEECECALDIRLYPVRDLVQQGDTLIVDPLGATNCDFDSLIETITSIVAPDTWDAVGGPGAGSALLPVPTIVFSQTQDVHEEIVALLTNLRAAKQLEAKRNPIGHDSDPEALVVRSYPILRNDCSSEEVASMVVRALGKATWEGDAGTFVQSLGSSIVVKHNAQVHAQVRKLLFDVGAQRGGFACGINGPCIDLNNPASSGAGDSAAPEQASNPGGFF